MDTLKRNNLLTWLVLILIVANVAVLTIFWMGHKRNEDRPHGTPAEFLTKQLGLNGKQQAQLTELGHAHHQASEKIRGRIKDARDQFFGLLKTPNVNDSAKHRAASAVSDNLKELELLTFDHFQQVRSICTPEQQKKFDEIINEVMQMVGGPPPGPPPGRRRDRQPMPPPESDSNNHQLP